MWYSLSFNKIAWYMLPVVLRKQVIVQFTYAIIRPLNNIHYTWRLYRESNMYKLSHNAQKCYFQKALNDTFDPELRRIYIDGTANDAIKQYVYTPPENQTKYLGTMYLRQSLEFADTGADFVVYVPAGILETQNYELRALIDFYKLGGKRYLLIEQNG